MPTREIARKSPEEWLAASEPEKKRGRLKIFLGYAPGVGKTFSMLSEGIRRRSRREDVVIGIVETHGRVGTAELAGKLEQVPGRELDYKGTLFAEMDVEAILERHPGVALIDELAHTNIEGSRNSKRYEDVFLLLDAGIDVLSTVNIQHIESLTPQVQSLTGVTVRETVPDWVLDRADEIVISDLTPEALVTRMRRGDIYPTDRAERALANFFRRGNLIALREMALQRVTRAVDQTLGDYVRRKQLGAHWSVAEKVAVCISANPGARDLIARGARLAHGLDAELYVLHVETDADHDAERRRTLDASLKFANNLGAHVVQLQGHNIASATAAFATEHRITQVIFGRSALTGLKKYLYFFAIQRFTSQAPHADLHIITQERQTSLMRILVVDDEPQITRVLRMSLQGSGYEVVLARDGEEALARFHDSAPDLIITDLAMPVMNGLELTRAVRLIADTPIIVLSVREQETTKVAALDEGADDYMTKPFSMQELLARVRAHLRKVARAEPAALRISEGDFNIDTEAHAARVRDSDVHLTPKEFDLLVFFARNPRRVLTHKTLLRAIWGPAGVNQPEYLRVLIAQLRKKIERADTPRYIRSEPWIGYRFDPEGLTELTAS